MHIRAATNADVPAITDIGDVAFIDNELNGWLYPRRREFPESWRARINRNVQLNLAKPGVYGFVCVTDEDDPSEWPRDEVVGYASWERNGPADDPLTTKWHQNNTGIVKAGERTLINWQNQYVDYFRLDKSLSREHKAVYDSEGAAMGNPFAPLTAFWKLVVIGVHPDWQGKGVGKKLVQWGMDRSDEDDVPIILIATAPGQRLYKRLGFDIVGWANTESFTWAEGGSIMIRDVKRKHTREAKGEEKAKDYFGRIREIDSVFV